MADDRLERILELLRTQGGRLTTSRRAIVAALLESGLHVTAEDLAEHVQAAHPDIHRSTIYRTLDTLAGLGVVDHVHLGHGPAVYHLTDQPHHHLVCDACGAVVELPARALSALRRRVERDYGFQLDPGHFALAGRCAACAPVG
ncbi:MAG: Fur family transcriptional regulator, ferric uptake regulator [Acidimicrobiaceae bacterium]|nr:Fur family transcriptional regulator, ferric uptake regulator [Acidimicrobiaceae bacterium]